MQFKTDELQKNSIILFTFSIVTGLVNYAFQIAIGNLLTQTEYGTINPLLSLINVLAVPSGIILVLSSKYAAHYTALERPASISSFLKGFMRVSVIFSAVILTLGVALSKPIANILKIENSAYVAACFATAAIGCIPPVLSGALQGKKLFVAYGATGLIASVGRIAFSVAFILFGLKVFGVMAALALTSIIIFVFCFLSLRKSFFAADDGSFRAERPRILNYLRSVIIVQLLIVVLSNGDILLINAFVGDPIQTATYSSGLIFGRIPIYLAGAIASVMFPLVSEKAARGESSSFLLTRSLLYSGAAGVIFSIGLVLFGRFILEFTFKDKYLAATELFLPICVYTLIVSLITVEVQYLQALGRTKALSIIVVLGFIATYIAVTLFHSSVAQILYAMASCFALVFAAILIVILLKKESSVSQASNDEKFAK